VNILKSIYLNRRFYITLLLIAVAFIFGYFFYLFFIIAKVLLLLFVVITILELIILLSGDFKGGRDMPDRFSNGDKNKIMLWLKNNYSIQLRGVIYDELPPQFQMRNFKIEFTANAKASIYKSYELKPVKRGTYSFGVINIFVYALVGFISRRFKTGEKKTVKVYPSFNQLKKAELIAFSDSRNALGFRKIQRIGNNREFEHIKEYVKGDDYRKINWKATARVNKLMVNEYQDERAQNVFQLIDMGRTMKMPFEEMTLLDYAINSTLALSNVILKKHDKIGLLTYSDHIHSFIQSDNKRTQLNSMLETLYKQETLFQESNLEQVYTTISRKTPGRSLLILYTNYESLLGLKRQLPILKNMAQKHLILLVSFINTELEKIVNQTVNNTEDIYFKTIAEKTMLEKNKFMEQLGHYGILNLRVRPQELTISVLNKYLEIKNRGIL
jgi:uncharacterized protein (DUF58 family)